MVSGAAAAPEAGRDLRDPDEAAGPAEVPQEPVPRLRIALVGHVCSPAHGSEPGFTWNWARSLARHHDVCVFSHPNYRAHVDEELAARPVEGLQFQWVNLTGFDPWRPERGEKGLQLHYLLWQRELLRVLNGAMAAKPFDLVHYVSWGSLHRPPLVWKTGLPFVWGPLGGGQTWPRGLLSLAGKRRWFERFRESVIRWASWNPSVVRAVRRSDLLLVTNRETAALVQALGARRVEVLLDGGVKDEWLVEPRRETAADEPGRPLWLLAGGRLEPRKGLPLALMALAKVSNKQVRLLVVGDGPQREYCRELAASLGLGERVEFAGMVPYAKMRELFAATDAFLFPSLRDSVGSVVLEAMAGGLPIVTLDHQGVACLVPPEAGIKVPVTDVEGTSAGLARAIDALAADPASRLRMSAAARACAARHTWDRRARRMSAWYREVLGEKIRSTKHEIRNKFK